jgi:glycosyltransferase involved in cell wall biosynthesis
VRIVRQGSEWTVHWAAFRQYRRRARREFDLVVDQVNTIPFFAPLWARIPTVMFIHQLAREIWWFESPTPINVVGYIAEPIYLRLYREIPAVTVSESTRRDLTILGFKRPVVVVPEGLETISANLPDKVREPTFVFVGRVQPSKRVEHTIEAFEEFVAEVGSGQLWLIGTGSERYRRLLRSHIRRRRLDSRVHFLGHVSIQEKHRRLAEAHALVMASVREGWGLVVLEANACGTPAVVYDVPGLRDAVRNEETGLVVEPSPSSLASGMIRIWRDRNLYNRLAAGGKEWSRSFSFDKSATAFREAIHEVGNGSPAGISIA